MNNKSIFYIKNFLAMAGISLTLTFTDMNYAMGFILIFSCLMLFVCTAFCAMVLIANLLLWGRAKNLAYKSLFLLLFWTFHCMVNFGSAKYAMTQLENRALAMRQDILRYKEQHGTYPKNDEIDSKINYLSFYFQYYSSTEPYIQMHKLFMETQNLDVKTGEFGELISQF